MADSPFAVPVAFQVYDSYAVDPQWQRYYTWTWLAVAISLIAISSPGLYRSVRNGSILKGWAITETTSDLPDYPSAPNDSEKSARARHLPDGTATCKSRGKATTIGRAVPGILARKSRYVRALRQRLFFFHIGVWGFGGRHLALTVGQLTLVAVYLALVLICIFKDAELKTNANRPGFMALAMLTPLFLLATKNNPLSLLLGFSYLSLNWAHRWVGRLLWLSATIHGFQWITYYAQTDSASTNLGNDKVLRGIASWVLLTVLAGSSIKPIRRRWYQLFWYIHMMAFVAFFAAVSYHTPYSRPWIWPPISLYVFEYRFKDAFLVALDDNLTMIHIPDCHHGWLPTQHVRIRILAKDTMFESHPLTITTSTAPPGRGRGIILFAKVAGDWTRKINAIATAGEEMIERTEQEVPDQAQPEASLDRDQCLQVQVLLDGPYGGLKFDLAEYQTVLIFAGGSGVTFALGCIEEAMRRSHDSGAERRLRHLQLVWAVKDLAIVNSLADILRGIFGRVAEIPHLELELVVHLTRSRSAGDALPLELSELATLAWGRPSISQLTRALRNLGAGDDSDETMEAGSMAVVACGPERLVQESRNAVAKLSFHEKIRVGSIAFHGEGYTI